MRKNYGFQSRCGLNGTIDAVFESKRIDLSTELSDSITQKVREDLDERISTAIDSRTDNLEQNIRNSLKVFISQELKSSQDIVERNITEKIDVKIDEQFIDISNRVINGVKQDRNTEIEKVVNRSIVNLSSDIKKEAIEQLKLYSDRKIEAVVNLKVTNLNHWIKNTIASEITNNVNKSIETVVNQKIDLLRQDIRNQVIERIQSDIKIEVDVAVANSTQNFVNTVTNRIKGNIDRSIGDYLNNRNDYYRNEVTDIVNNKIELSNEEITQTIIKNIKNHEFFVDMRSIKEEIDNFFTEVVQLESNINSRISSGDTELRNWTLEQLTALQGCLSDRQTISYMFEKFASELKDELDNADCVQPTRFTTSWATTEQKALSPAQQKQLPGS